MTSISPNSLTALSTWSTAGGTRTPIGTMPITPQATVIIGKQTSNPIIEPLATPSALTLEHYPEWPIWSESGPKPWWWDSGQMPTDPAEEEPPAGPAAQGLDLEWSITGTIKNIFAEGYWSEAPDPTVIATSAVQASALVFQGPQQFSIGGNTVTPKNALTITSKPMDADIMGSRLRIIGKLNAEDNTQQPLSAFDIVTSVTPDSATAYSEKTIVGGSAGITMFYNPIDDSGYFFEIVALPSMDITLYTDINVWGLQNAGNLGTNAPGVYNIMFYRQGSDKIARPLWLGLGNIICNSGSFVGLGRMADTDNVSVYDLAIESSKNGSSRVFKLYINGKMVATVTDTGTALSGPNCGMYVRGSTLAMFENIYGVKNRTNSASLTVSGSPIDGIVSPTKQNAIEYQLPPFISMALSGISTQNFPDFTLEYEEFGTILREVAYIQAKYDKFPALWAKVAPLLVREKAYVPSRLYSTPYGAEFLVFNVMDSAVTLDAQTGNYLRILGVTLTQETTKEFTVDKMLKDSKVVNDSRLNVIAASRLKHGEKAFNMDSTYLQNKAAANRMMEWILQRKQAPRDTLSIRIFANPALQIGDVLFVEYLASDNTTVLSGLFSITTIQYSRQFNVVDMIIEAVQI